MFSSVIQSCPTLCDPMDSSMPGFPVRHQLPESSPTPGVYSNTCSLSWWCHSIISSSVISSSCLQSFPASRSFPMSQFFLIRWPKYWSFSFSISPSNEYSELISFRMDWLDLLAVQETLKSLLQHHSSKASVLQCSAFFMVQLSHPYMTTGKTIALNRWTVVDKLMSLLFNMMSRLVIAFLPRSKSLLNSSLKPSSVVNFEPLKIKSLTVSPVSLSICHEVMGPDAMILVCWMLSFNSTFSLSSYTFIKRFFSSSFTDIRMVSPAYLRLLIFLLVILIPVCVHPAQHFSWCTLHIS